MGVGIGLLISGLLGSVGSLISSGMQMNYNSKEAEKSRAFSEKENALNRQFQAEQAQINRDWQTDMSNTAYQRSVADMKEAGLNPNLMSGGLQAQVGSVSTPQGSSSSSAQASSSFGNIFSGLSSALNAYATIKNQELIAKMYNDTYRSNNFASNNSHELIARMYNDTSRTNNIESNKIRKYASDRASTAYENVAFNNYYRDAKNREHFYEYLKAHKYD